MTTYLPYPLRSSVSYTHLNHVDGRSIGMAYFRNRGFRDDIIEKFQLGYCTEAHDAFAKEATDFNFLSIGAWRAIRSCEKELKLTLSLIHISTQNLSDTQSSGRFDTVQFAKRAD